LIFIFETYKQNFILHINNIYIATLLY